MELLCPLSFSVTTELARLRHSVKRGTPFGSEAWILETARRLGLESSVRPPGRPPQNESPLFR